MKILYHQSTQTFHLHNADISYIMTVLPNGQMGQIYFGRRIHDREDFSYLVEIASRPMSASVDPERKGASMEHLKQELPVYGATDFRCPAVELLQKNGSRISEFLYVSHEIRDGKPKLSGLPATYTEKEEEAKTLTVVLKDPVTGVKAELFYTVFQTGGILARSVRYTNEGGETVDLTRAMSLSLDLPDSRYEWMQFSGAWGRERQVKIRRLEQGIQSVGSLRGHSSHQHNPFVVLKRPETTEEFGEAIGFSLIYSGNFLMQAEVDTYDVTRMMVGIHPDMFQWKLEAGEVFQTPEAVMVYTHKGLNHMSRTFHQLYQRRLARGYWRERPRPILINNWEATYFDFTEERLLQIADKAKSCGVEMFVLDDGWFGKRSHERAGLGDWTPNPDRLPEGVAGLAEKIEKLGMRFGLWFEPEMVNEDSDLYRAHPDWVLETPGRKRSHGRFQYVLDFSREEVVECIYKQMAEILSNAKVSYVKWDMNRSITECYSKGLPPDRQGEVFHRYILGVYALYERLIEAFPQVLFESCASGGGRFDPGLLYYAPQCWTSDDTDGVERLKIQYGTSFCYPISSMGSHVSSIPNHQLHRNVPLHTRANVAYFGTFGYELDLNSLTEEELAQVKEQIAFMKQYREIIQYGDFYRLGSPCDEDMAWMTVSRDKKTAIVGWYRILNRVNASYTRLRLAGLKPDWLYRNSLSDTVHYGDELMNLGIVTTDSTAGESAAGEMVSGDYASRVYVLTAGSPEKVFDIS